MLSAKKTSSRTSEGKELSETTGDELFDEREGRGRASSPVEMPPPESIASVAVARSFGDCRNELEVMDEGEMLIR